MDYETPDILLALAYAPSRARGEIETLFYIDAALARLVRSAREPALAQIKLAWWREQLAGGPARGEPLLERLKALPRLGDCSELATGWEAMVGDPDWDVHAVSRGGALFRIAARLCDADEALAEAAGRYWALARNGKSDAVFPSRVNELPIFLGILVILAMRDAQGRSTGLWRDGSPLRMARAAAFALLRR